MFSSYDQLSLKFQPLVMCLCLVIRPLQNLDLNLNLELNFDLNLKLKFEFKNFACTYRAENVLVSNNFLSRFYLESRRLVASSDHIHFVCNTPTDYNYIHEFNTFI